MKLPGSDLEGLLTVICNAFDRNALRQLLRFKLEIEYDLVIKTSNFSSEVFDLLQFLERRGQLVQFLREARQNNPRNAELDRISSEIEAKLVDSKPGLEKNPSSPSA